MERTIEPDRKLLTKYIFVLLTITPFIAILAAIIHLISLLKGGDPNLPIVLWIVAGSIIAAMWAIAYPLLRLWIKNLKYSILEDRITIHKGILTKTEQNIPYRSITDFVLYRSIYDRLLGIASIKIQTAGQSQSASGYEGQLAGLIEYEKLHAELQHRLKDLHPISEALTTSEAIGGSSENILEQILVELKAIRKNLDT